MKLPNTAHTSRPWRIHEIAHDFLLEDVWALPTPGGPDDFPRLVRQMTSGSNTNDSRAYTALFEIRWRLGKLFGWDRPDAGIVARVPSLRDRLPADLLAGPRGPVFSSVPFTSVYQTDDEWVAEMANRTVHALMHMSWVADEGGGYHGQMAVLVKPNGWFGRGYMAAIKPIRYLVVYPALLRMIGRTWELQAAG
ncbi:DUF2867 domain-containing protein [Nocardia sp. BMG51109]|uniref:DUF2867 domain-containing protein n=1 Tax=Nocardia sp. BMG51109 TaxID=1056816 RepID=UPI00046724DF|nr:DUF2867 domain-containing protein [Nocardia sp. BMG51109]